MPRLSKNIMICSFIFFLLFTLTGFSTAAPIDSERKAMVSEFNDVSSSDVNTLYINYMAKRGLFSGFPDGSFHPAEGLTRAQAATLLCRVKGLSAATVTQTTFNDVAGSHWAAPYINAASQAGYITGFPDNTYQPESVLTRAQGISLFLRLSSNPNTGEELPSFEDMDKGHWAASSMATALAAGMITAGDSKINPEQAFSRGDLAKALSILITKDPTLNQNLLTGKLKVKNGDVRLKRAGSEESKPVSGTSIVKAGDTVTTGKDGEAEINYPDGSGILLKFNSELIIKEAKGSDYIKIDGTPGTAIDYLEIELKNGKIFGALASKYTGSAEENQTASNDRYKLLASRDNNFDLLAAKETEQWYKTAEKKKVKVKVDMPWGVAAIRGTFWSNTVSSNGCGMSILTGDGYLNSGGQTQNLSPGQSSGIGTQGSPPSPPAPMSPSEAGAWSQQRSWVTNRAGDIQNNQGAPLGTPPGSQPGNEPGQPGSNPMDNLMNNLNNALNQAGVIAGTGSGSSSSGGSSGSGGNNTVTQVMAPTANPAAGSYIDAQTVTLSTATVGATIYYTSDGSDPKTSSTRVIYSAPINIAENTTIKAYAIKTGMTDSYMVSFTYAIGNVANENSTISPDITGFDKNPASQADITIAMTLNSNTLSSIMEGSNTLVAGSDYTINGNNVIIKKEYLADKSIGTLTLSFQFSAGDPANLVIDITDSTVLTGSYTFSRQWGGFFNVASTPQGAASDAAGNIYVADPANHQIFKFDSAGNILTRWGSEGTGDGQFRRPWAVAVDSANTVYVCDLDNGRIQKFDSNGVFLAKWGSIGSSNGQFNLPTGVATDSAGNVYIADKGNSRVQKFASDGTFISVIGTFGYEDGQFYSPYGIALDSANNIYVVDYGVGQVQKFDSTGTFLCKFGSVGSALGQLEDPEGIAVNGSGTLIYVADSYNQRIQVFAYDESSQNYVYSNHWGSSGTGDGQFKMPTGVALVDSAGRVYVTERFNSRIQKFDTSGLFTGKIEMVPIGDGRFNSPTRGLAVDSSNGWIYVSDTNNHRIQKFDANGNFLIKWGTQGSENGQFNGPTGLALDSAGNVYAADTQNHRIQKFAPDGSFICKWGDNGGSSGSGNGQLNQPAGIYVDADNNVYVADYYNYRIQKFTYDGQVGNYIYSTQWGTWGNDNGQFNYPVDVKGDNNGHIYVSDFSRNRIQKFDANGNFITTWGSYGTADGQFLYQQGIGVDSNGNVYVADRDNNRIQIFDSNGGFITSMGTSGNGAGELNYPTGVAVDPSGNLYLLDTRNYRVEVFSPSGGNNPVTQVRAPTASPAAGSYIDAQTVTLSTTTVGATIYYTTDGSDPKTSSTQVAYSTPISVSAATTIKAYAAKSGMSDSEVASFAYTINGGQPAIPEVGINPAQIMEGYINANIIINHGDASSAIWTSSDTISLELWQESEVVLPPPAQESWFINPVAVSDPEYEYSTIESVLRSGLEQGMYAIVVLKNNTPVAITAIEVIPAQCDYNKSTTEIDGLLALETGRTVTAVARTSDGIPVPGYRFILDIDVTNNDATRSESYLIDGISYTADATGVEVTTPTDANGITTFNIVLPPLVDNGDGISVKVKTDNIAYHQYVINNYMYTQGNQAPELTAAESAYPNTVPEYSFEITFNDDEDWRSAITGIVVGGITLKDKAVVGSNGAYELGAYEPGAGYLRLYPFDAYPLQNPGQKCITVKATGYEDAAVLQMTGLP